MKINSVFLIGLFILTFIKVHSCDFSVRQHAFSDDKLQKYELYLFTDNNVPDAVEDRLKKLVHELMYNSNVGVINLNIDRVPSDHSVLKFLNYKHKKLNGFPEVVMVDAENDREMPLNLSPSDPEFKGKNKEKLQRIISSPYQLSLKPLLIDHYSVILFKEGKDPKENERYLIEIKKAIKENATQYTDLFKKNKVKSPKLEILKYDQLELEDEFLFGLHVDETTKDLPIVYVLYGRGRMVKKPLVADSINADAVINKLNFLSFNCECLEFVDTHFAYPFKWTVDLQKRLLPQYAHFFVNPSEADIGELGKIFDFHQLARLEGLSLEEIKSKSKELEKQEKKGLKLLNNSNTVDKEHTEQSDSIRENKTIERIIADNISKKYLDSTSYQNEIDIQTKEKEIEEIEKQSNIYSGNTLRNRIFIGIGIIALLLVLFMLFRSYRKRE